MQKVLKNSLPVFAPNNSYFAAICYAITQSSSAIAVILPITGYIGFFIVLVIKTYQYSVASFAIVDNTDVKVTQSLERSRFVEPHYLLGLQGGAAQTG